MGSRVVKAGENMRVKRVYDKAEKFDGKRVLVDRLWPRGVSKKKAKIDIWAKELTPSNELREWFHDDREKRFAEFSKRYSVELRGKVEDAKEISKLQRYTLITAVKDLEHSHIPTLVKFLESTKLI